MPKQANMKSMYDSLECTACGIEEENKQHILECSILNQNKNLEESKYGKIFNGTVSDKVKIARRFKENFDRLEKMKK